MVQSYIAWRQQTGSAFSSIKNLTGDKNGKVQNVATHTSNDLTPDVMWVCVLVFSRLPYKIEILRYQ
jgi:hypothetical protein